jgi:DMSO/TMAO reductase YedYZ molybdopterin-dependent catalytic subunit
VPRNLTNVLLGLSVAVALATGVLAFGTGSPGLGWALAIAHGVVGLVLVVLALAKSRIVETGWSAGRTSRWGGGVLTGLAVVTLASGVAQALGWRDLGPLSAMQVHVPAAIATGVGVVWHGVIHPGPWRALRAGRVMTSRRSALRTLGVGALAVASWTSVELVAAVLRGGEGRRRFTGSERLDRPLVTQWFTDRVPRDDPDLTPDRWRLQVADADGDRQLDLSALVDHPDRREVTAVLDCTGGWYADTTWEGVPLSSLLTPAPGDRCVEVISSTGYRRRLPLDDLDHLFLATQLAGQPLTAGHGAPARLVAPGRRGFWWVKWVTAVRTSPAHWTAQPPFPLR